MRTWAVALMMCSAVNGAAEAQAAIPTTATPQIGDITHKDLESRAGSNACATGYQRAYVLRATPEDAPLVFVDGANTALIKLNGKLVELKTVAHLDRDSNRTRSFIAVDGDITVEQTFRTVKEKKGVLEIPVLRGSIKITTHTGSTTIWVVGKPHC